MLDDRQPMPLSDGSVTHAYPLGSDCPVSERLKTKGGIRDPERWCLGADLNHRHADFQSLKPRFTYINQYFKLLNKQCVKRCVTQYTVMDERRLVKQSTLKPSFKPSSQPKPCDT